MLMLWSTNIGLTATGDLSTLPHHQWLDLFVRVQIRPIKEPRAPHL